MTRSAIEDAVHEWARATSGLDGEAVVWANQDGPRPDTRYVLLAMSAPLVVGVDAITHSFDSSRRNGQEIGETVSGARTMTVTVDVVGGDAVGDDSAAALASSMQQRAQLPAARDRLARAGAGLMGVGQIQDLTGLVRGSTEARARFVLTLAGKQEATERTGYISTVTITNTDTDEDTVV